MFILIPLAFPGVLNWQHRLWLTVREFHGIRNNNSVQKCTIDSSTFKNEEIKLHDSRNYYVKKTSSNFRKSYQLSVAISKLQGLTTSLRVYNNKIHNSFYRIQSYFNFCRSLLKNWLNIVLSMKDY